MVNSSFEQPAKPVILVIEPPRELLDTFARNPCNVRSIPMSKAMQAFKAYAGTYRDGDQPNSDWRR